MGITNITEVKTIKKINPQTGPRRGPVISPGIVRSLWLRKGMLFEFVISGCRCPERQELTGLLLMTSS